ncbi:unnamed protein product, partial [Closterium sp. NIES-53]
NKADDSDWEECTFASPHSYCTLAAAQVPLLLHKYPCCYTGTGKLSWFEVCEEPQEASGKRGRVEGRGPTSAMCDSRTAKLALEDKCGRPVGMAFHPTTGDLYFADAYYGLFKVRNTLSST